MAASTINESNALKPLKIEEVVFVSVNGTEDNPWNVAVYDVRTGNQLQVFRNGSARKSSLCMLGGECLLAASVSKPMVHVWNMLKQSQKHRKIITGFKISCMAISPGGHYLAAGTDDKIHIWQVCNGVLFSILSYGSVEVKALKFSPDGKYLVSGYKDGAFPVWELQEVLCYDSMSMMEHRPFQTFLGHTGEITDFHITVSNRVVSAAIDFSVRVWDLVTAEQLKIFELGDALVNSVIIDNLELTLYAGDNAGCVHCIDLNHSPDTKTVYLDSGEKTTGYTKFPAHSGPVRYMGLNQDQTRLVSAEDRLVKIWSMMSPVAPIKVELNEDVTNLSVMSIPPGMASPDNKPQCFLGNLSRYLHGSAENESSDDILCMSANIQSVNDLSDVSNKSNTEKKLPIFNHGKVAVRAWEAKVSSLEDQANKLKKANEQMYTFALKNIVK